jgi:hypothetical protein
VGDILHHQLMHDQRRQVVEQVCVVDEKQQWGAVRSLRQTGEHGARQRKW